MRLSTVFSTALFATLLATYGCASDSSVDADQASDELVARDGTAQNGVRVCTGAFFDAHPVTGTKTDSQGFVMPAPLAACDAEAAVIAGLSDYAAVARRMEGTGYEPVRLAGGKAVTFLYVIEYGKSDLGPYRESFVGYSAVKVGVQGDSEIPVVNNFSTLLPTFMPLTELFMDRLVLERGRGDIAIRAGIEHYGLDKRSGNVTMTNERASTSFGITDETNAAVADVSFTLDLTPSGQFAAANELAQAFGLADATQLPPPGDELVLPLVNKDRRRPGTMHQWSSVFNKPTSAFGAFGPKDRLELGSGELGRILADVAFRPQVATRYFDIDVVFPER